MLLRFEALANWAWKGLLLFLLSMIAVAVVVPISSGCLFTLWFLTAEDTPAGAATPTALLVAFTIGSLTQIDLVLPVGIAVALLVGLAQLLKRASQWIPVLSLCVGRAAAGLTVGFISLQIGPGKLTRPVDPEQAAFQSCIALWATVATSLILAALLHAEEVSRPK